MIATLRKEFPAATPVEAHKNPKRGKRRRWNKTAPSKVEQQQVLLYDRLGRPLLQTEPGDAARPRKRITAKQESIAHSKPRRWWLRGRRIVPKIVGLAASLIGIYTFRPVLSVASLATSHDSGLAANATITVTGSGIRNVTVECVPNKATFDWKYTLELHNYFDVKEYSVRNVAAGESFVADCPLRASMLMGATDGYFFLGSVGPVSRMPGIRFSPLGGDMRAEAGVIEGPFWGYREIPATQFDGSIIVRYTPAVLPFRWASQARTIHLIAAGNGFELQWRVAPNSEPMIRDAPASHGGFKLIVSLRGDGYAFIGEPCGAGRSFADGSCKPNFPPHGELNLPHSSGTFFVETLSGAVDLSLANPARP